MCWTGCGKTGCSARRSGARKPGADCPPCRPWCKLERPRRDIGFHFVDQVAREAKSVAGIDAITASSYTVRSTIDPQLQRAVEEALQEGLSRYERGAGRVQFLGPEANLVHSHSTVRGRPPAAPTSGRIGSRRSPKRACRSTTSTGHRRRWWRSRSAKAERRLARRPRRWARPAALGRQCERVQRKLALYDVVYVRVVEGRGKAAVRAELRVRPVVQGMVVVLENKTGRILAMSGGFSYPLSQLNRATQAVRQPGSAIKPLSYLGDAGQGPAAQHAGQRRCDHPAADQGRPHPGPGLLVAEELRRRRRRHADVAPRAREFAQSRHRASAPGRHRGQAGSEPRAPVQARAGSADLS